ncbi:hypothetical protein BMETH_1140_0 [methanotrophic bacterial endosymbiont of Bathymodiolus sp.]|nr:hypothetical protein BMETH_1140_0 [methanotrophic bacterial endosymbiont of Bathymodiolus sp.]
MISPTIAATLDVPISSPTITLRSICFAITFAFHYFIRIS